MSERHPTPPEAISPTEDQEIEEPNPALAQAIHRLSPNFLTYSDLQEERGKKPIYHNKEFLQFLATFNSAYLESLNQILAQNLQQADPDNKKGYDNEDKKEIFKKYEENLESLHANYSIQPTDEEAEFFIQTNLETKNIDYAKFKEKAKEYNLELSIIRGSEAAERLLLEVINKNIDITKKEGQKEFIDKLNKECPNLPPPCVQAKNWDGFWYLKQLAQNRIISNLEGEDRQYAIPRFQEYEILFVDNWTEQNYGTDEATESHRSELVKALLGNDGSTVNISREDLDNALWTGDPANRQPTKKHKEILKQLGCDPKEFELRPIKQDEYARLAPAKGYGQKDLWTNFDNYFLEDDGGRGGLGGGYRGAGGASDVGYYWRGYAYDALAVRLVLSRKQK